MFHKHKKLWIILSFILLAGVIGCGIYLGGYYSANEQALQALVSDDKVSVSELKDGSILFAPDEPTAGFIFYPGGKVEVDAYYPLMVKCAENGILSVAVEMPFNLAVFDINGAEGIKEKYSEIEDWYIGGHSLGGSMAASFLGKNQDDIKGLILLASYSTVDFSNSDIKILSIFGSEDKVLNLEKYAEYKLNLSKNTSEFVIEGGNHAGFGFYGKQKGDGTATISSQEQIEKTEEIIAEFVASTTLSNR
jgi:hypothetical protein